MGPAGTARSSCQRTSSAHQHVSCRSGRMPLVSLSGCLAPVRVERAFHCKGMELSSGASQMDPLCLAGRLAVRMAVAEDDWGHVTPLPVCPVMGSDGHGVEGKRRCGRRNRTIRDTTGSTMSRGVSHSSCEYRINML